MKSFLFIIWMLLTVLLALSIIGGLFLIIPKSNDGYVLPQEDLRSTWMRIGYGFYIDICQHKSK